MTKTIDRRPVDLRVYEEELAPWLPEEIIDIHVHVCLDSQLTRPFSAERRAAMWPLDIGLEQSWETLRATYAALFPKQRVTALAFGSVLKEIDIDATNRYIMDGTRDPSNLAKGLFVSSPEMSVGTLEEALSMGFLGIKPYPDLAPRDTDEVSIYEFLPHEHLQAMNRLKGIVILHIPRKGRLSDPDNIRELLEISDRYPDIRLIVAHIGRAYCMPTAEPGLLPFADRPNVLFDTAAHLNADVFQYALEMVGPDRLLFGTDLPVTLMRGMREHVGNQYINYTDGPYGWNKVRKSPEEEANYTFFIYEELKALIEAVKRAGLGKDAFRKIMYTNSLGVMGEV